jgi:uncharacterized protein (TIGR02145 family)
MQMKKVIFASLLILLSGIIQAQELVVHKTDGTYITIPINSIDSITFVTQSASLTDIQGNTYKTVLIGNQTWMAENLRVTKLNDGSAIPYVIDNTAWGNLTTPGYCFYNNDSNTYKATYGMLYNWYTVSTGNVCPTDWHVPGDAEWTIIENFLGGASIAGGKMKETGTTHWQTPNTGADNSSGFLALPGGLRANTGIFYNIFNAAQFWSSTESNSTTAWMRYANYNNTALLSYAHGKVTGFAIRCIKN